MVFKSGFFITSPETAIDNISKLHGQMYNQCRTLGSKSKNSVLSFLWKMVKNDLKRDKHQKPKRST